MKNIKEKVLVIDDDESICKLCVNSLRLNKFDAMYTTKPGKALSIVKNNLIDLVLTDIKMPDIDGLEILRQLKDVSADIAVVIMTAYSSTQVAINAINDGAYSFIPKPFNLSEMLLAVKSALERKHLLKEIIRLKTLVNLFNVTEKINSNLEISQLLQTMIDAIIKETKSEKAIVFYPDEETDELYARCAVGMDDIHIEQIRFPAKQGIIGSVFEEKKTLLVNNITEQHSLSIEQIRDIYGNKMLAIPMQSKEKTLGVISLFKDDNSSSFTEADKDIAAILTSQAAVALDNAELILDLEILFLESMKSLAKTVDERDPYTHGHSHRVSKIALLIGEAMGFSETELENLAHGGILHDIGKIGIPDEILFKPGPITKDEYEIIKTHPEKGYNILKPIQKLSQVVEMVYTHHEWFNGRGYPRGLQGDEIPLAGSIISVADAYDTITTDRVYRHHQSYEEALNILKKHSNTQFHPEVVSVITEIDVSKLKSLN